MLSLIFSLCKNPQLLSSCSTCFKEKLYLKAFLGFLGMNDLTVITADGLKVSGYKEMAMEKAYQKIEIE